MAIIPKTQSSLKREPCFLNVSPAFPAKLCLQLNWSLDLAVCMWHACSWSWSRLLGWASQRMLYLSAPSQLSHKHLRPANTWLWRGVAHPGLVGACTTACSHTTLMNPSMLLRIQPLTQWVSHHDGPASCISASSSWSSHVPFGT